MGRCPTPHQEPFWKMVLGTPKTLPQRLSLGRAVAVRRLRGFRTISIYPPPRQLCCLTNKNTAVPIDASIMGTAAFFFARHSRGRWEPFKREAKRLPYSQSILYHRRGGVSPPVQTLTASGIWWMSKAPPPGELRDSGERVFGNKI